MNGRTALADLNAFTIFRIDDHGARSLITGRLSLPGRPSEGDQINLLTDADVDVFGQIDVIDPDAGTAVIRLSTADLVPAVAVGATFPICDNYGLSRIRLILDPEVSWTRRTFAASDAFEQLAANGWVQSRAAKPGDEARTDGRLVAGGWDHEHCEFCWGTVGRGGDPAGWATDGGLWACDRCHAGYVEPRDLGFASDGADDGLDAPPDAGREAFDAVCHLIDAYDLGAVRAWLAAEDSPDVRNRYGWTPLMVAACRGHASLVTLLLSAGADPSAVAEGHGCTPLALAAQRGHVAVTRTLLEAGATARVPGTFWGGSLLQYVKSGPGREDPAISALLADAGAT